MLIDKTCNNLYYHVTEDLKPTSQVMKYGKQENIAQGIVVYIPAVKIGEKTVKKDELKIYRNVESVTEDSTQFYAKTNCLTPVRRVLQTIEKYFPEKQIVYGEFSCGIGSTLRAALPYCKTAYVTDFALKVSITKKMLDWEYKKSIVKYKVLKDSNSLSSYLIELKSKKVLFDVIFYDADHEHNYPFVFTLLKTMTRILIVHDTVCKAVKEDCDSCLSGIYYEQFDDKQKTRAYVIDKNLIQKACLNM